MADTLKRLCGPTNLAVSTATNLYTVPAGVTAVVRNIHISNYTTSDRVFTLWLNAQSGTSNTLYWSYTVPANGAFDWSGMLVMAATDYLFGTNVSNGLTITVSGVEVS